MHGFSRCLTVLSLSELSVGNSTIKAALSQVKSKLQPRRKIARRLQAGISLGSFFFLHASWTSSRCVWLALLWNLLCRSVSFLRIQGLPECINLLSIAWLSHPPALKQRRSREDVPMWAGHALCLKCGTHPVKHPAQPEKPALPASTPTAERAAPVPNQEWLEILLKYGCLINREAKLIY